MKKFAKITKLICVIALIGVFMFMFVFCVFFPRSESDYSLQKTWPEFSFESLFSGEYFKGVTEYFTDTVYGRDRFVDYNTQIKSLYGLPEDEVVVIIDGEGNGGEQSDWVPVDESDTSGDVSQSISGDTSGTFSNDESQSTSSVDTSSDDPVEPPPVELSGSVLIIGTRAMEMFSGNLKNGTVFAETLNEFASKLDSSVRVYSMVIPKASAFYIAQSEKYGEKYASKNKENIDNINNSLSDRVTPVDVYSLLEQHANEEIFFRTDHHWTALGGYYGARAFAEAANVAVPDIANFTENIRSGYVGTLYKYSDYNPVLLNNPENLVSYIPKSGYTAMFYDHSLQNGFEHSLFFEIADDKRSSWYSTFIRGDRYAVKITSDNCKNGRKLLIVKDSYGNVLSPFLIDSFEEILVVDGREVTIGVAELVETYGITDVLFTECSFSAVGAAYITDIKRLTK